MKLLETENTSKPNEVQHKTIRTSAFKKWFGDWEKSPKTSSKMVNEKGEPLVCFHATNSSDFDEFSYKAIGSANDNGFYGKGFYFTFQKESKNTQWAVSEASYYGRRIIPAYLNIRNPFNFEVLTQYKGSHIGGIHTQSLVFLYNVAKMFPSISDQIFVEKKVATKRGGEYDIVKVPTSVLPKLIEKYSSELKTLVRKNSSGEQVVEGYVKSKIVEYDNTSVGGQKGSYEDKDFLSGHFDFEENARNKEEMEITFVGLALEKYDGISPSFFVEGYMTRNPEISEAIRENYDGIIQNESGDEVVVFKPNQIKIADGTNTTFDSENPSIKYRAGGNIPSVEYTIGGL